MRDRIVMISAPAREPGLRPDAWLRPEQDSNAPRSNTSGGKINLRTVRSPFGLRTVLTCLEAPDREHLTVQRPL